MSTIKSINYDEVEILHNINYLFLSGAGFECDPTYGRGKFYKSSFPEPKLKFDLLPRFDFVNQSCATELPIKSGGLGSLIFDPPFVAGHTKQPTGIIGKKYHGFPYMKDVWGFYEKAITEHSRIVRDGGIYVFKCQDSCSADRNWISHVRVIALAEAAGFYARDLFILLAKNRLIGHNHKHTQKHARKFHSYFIVFEKMPLNKINKQRATIA